MNKAAQAYGLIWPTERESLERGSAARLFDASR